MQSWFKEAKFGILIHWGIYSVNGINESWPFFNNEISYEDYMRQCDGFTAKNYDPDAWAMLFRKSGARYAVLTTKHHDGVALYDSSKSELNVVKKTPARRDLVGPFCEAMRKHGLKVGLYFSHLDWSHPDYSSLCRRDEHGKIAPPGKPYGYAKSEDDLEAWKRFLQFHRGQLKELSTQYGLIDLFWFDGDWDRSLEQWDMPELREYLHSFNPNVILNSRMKGYGDYETPEQGLPIRAPEGAWEFSMTMNDSWGYQYLDQNYKSVRQIIRIFTECISMGGNLLLGIGPRADGTFDSHQEKVLMELGLWMDRHEESIYSTVSGLPQGHYFGASTFSADRKTLYLFVYDRPWESICIKGIKNPVDRIIVVGAGETLKYNVLGGAPWHGVPGTLWIEIPEHVLDPNTTVIRLDFKEPLELYGGSGTTIDMN